LGLTSDEILTTPQAPRSLVVVGGGVVGMEFAAIFNQLGTRVIVVEPLDQLLSPLDTDIATRFQQLMTRRGVEFHLKARVEKIERGGSAYRVTFNEQTVETDLVLVATGRRPNTEDMGLEEAGVARERGAIKVDRHLRTSVHGVYAIGDATMVSMLAHTATYQGEVAVINAIGEKRVSADYRAIPACVHTDPEIAYVGLSEMQARAAGDGVEIGTIPFRALVRAMVLC